MARTTLEMFIKVLGANKAAKELDNVSDSAEKTHNQVNKNTKENAKFAAGMSSLTKGAIAGAALFAGKQLLDFAQSSIFAASSAQEAAGAFGTTFGGAAEQLGEQLSKNANLFGLTTSEAKQLIGVFGAVAQGMGFTQDESADLSSRLFELSGDIASFNNVSSGAEPVLRAFQSAIVGEREALKTYGIAISEAEVQTKAFEMTGKTSADALTRQEKALATTELLFSKASVQIGNAEREAEGFAAQMLQTRAKTQELREEVGTELLPAAGELIGVFNNFVDDVSPAVIAGFGLINDAIVATVDATDKGTDALSKYFRIFILGQAALYGNEEAVEELNKALNENRKITNQNSVQVVGSTGITMDFMDVVSSLNNVYANFNDGLKENRQQVLISTTQTKKYGDEIDKRLNPIFGEQNRLLLTNIQLETDRKKLIDLITDSAAGVARATQQRNQATKELNELQIQENVRDAEAAIRKAELQTQIALLNDAKANGKDVTLDLALAEAELAEAEFELANDSDRLTLARERLDIAEQNLQRAIENQEKAIQKRNDLLVESIDLTNQQAEANKKIDQSALLAQFRAIETAPLSTFKQPSTTEVPSLPVTDFSTTLGNGNGGKQISGEINLNLTDAVGEVIQKEVIKIQERGNTLIVE
jgi:hypothetical protein